MYMGNQLAGRMHLAVCDKCWLPRPLLLVGVVGLRWHLCMVGQHLCGLCSAMNSINGLPYPVSWRHRDSRIPIIILLLSHIFCPSLLSGIIYI